LYGLDGSGVAAALGDDDAGEDHDRGANRGKGDWLAEQQRRPVLPATQIAVADLDPWLVAFGRAVGAALLACAR
jgi:hypothetical protein